MTKLHATAGLKHEQLFHELRARIKRGVYGTDGALESEKELCQQYGVSRGTVRHALAALERESLITSMAGKGWFVSARATTRDSSRIHMVRVLVDASAGLDDNFVVLEIVEGLNRAIARVGVKAKLHYEFHRFQGEGDHGPEGLLHGADGVLVVPFTSYCVRFLEQLQPGAAPVVALFDRVDSDLISSIYINHEESAFRATSLLARLGHRRIAFLGHPMPGASVALNDRFVGYQRALSEMGIGLAPRWVEAGDTDRIAVREAVRRLLDQPERPTAVLIGGGLLTQACVQTIHQMGLSVPQDLSIIAFDDTVDAASNDPPLSVIKLPLEKLAERALQQLFGEMADPDRSRVQSELVPDLIIRDSCGHVASE